jgi:glyoxylase-like metal-dependent hydrolase (beta-lactamase superfamily II)
VSGAGSNVVVGNPGGDGLLLVDGGAPQHSAELLKRIAEEAGVRKVKTLFNTHWHWDHTGSNEALGRSGATIVAHENTRLWLTEEIISKWENRTYPPLPQRARPTQTFFYGTHEMSFGSGKVEYGYLPQAHTDGDLYVFFPEANVLAAGDVASGGTYPIADYCTGGWLGGMVQALKALIEKSNAETQIVPGSGPLRTRADLQAQLDMCYQVLARIGDSYFKGETWAQLVESAPTSEFDAKWGEPDLFLRTAYEGAWLHINEIRRVTR